MRTSIKKLNPSRVETVASKRLFTIAISAKSATSPIVATHPCHVTGTKPHPYRFGLNQYFFLSMQEKCREKVNFFQNRIFFTRSLSPRGLGRNGV